MTKPLSVKITKFAHRVEKMNDALNEAGEMSDIDQETFEELDEALGHLLAVLWERGFSEPPEPDFTVIQPREVASSSMG